jgi:hypothetical protein
LFASQGIDLDHEQYKAKYKEMQQRADAKRQGFIDAEESGEVFKDFKQATLSDLGIEIEIEGE